MTKWYTRWCGCAFLSQSFCSTINFRFTRLWRKRVIFCYSIVIANKIYMYYIFSKKTVVKQQLSWQLNKQRIASWYKSLITWLKNGLPDQLNKSLSSVCYILHYFLHWYNVGIVKLKKQKNTNFVWNPWNFLSHRISKWYKVIDTIHCAQAAVLHPLSSDAGPSQGIVVEEHVLDLLCLPPPHRLLQEVHKLHVSYAP